METKATNQTFGLHEKNQAGAIWEGRYKTPLQISEQEYKIARTNFLFIRDHWPKYAENLFGGDDLLIPSAVVEFENVKRKYVDKGMTYASTLFSAMNSPFNFFKAYSMQLELREVVCELEKLGSSYYSPTQKEVMIAFLMKLMDGFRGSDANKEYYGACAEKYVKEVIGDPEASFATRKLVLARAASISSISLDQRMKYKEEVLGILFKIRNDPEKICVFEQDWKTYVRLARMVFAWRCMFFGLSHDKSKDLHLKSYVYFVRNCYKK
jgi:hypothetical protein